MRAQNIGLQPLLDAGCHASQRKSCYLPAVDGLCAGPHRLRSIAPVILLVSDPADSKDMLRYVLVFLPLFLLGGVACAAAVAAASPTVAEFVFLVCLGLFVAALADGVSEPGSERRE